MANALSDIGKGFSNVMQGTGKVLGNVLQGAGQAMYRGFPEATMRRQLGEAEIKSYGINEKLSIIKSLGGLETEAGRRYAQIHLTKDPDFQELIGNFDPQMGFTEEEKLHARQYKAGLRGRPTQKDVLGQIIEWEKIRAGAMDPQFGHKVIDQETYEAASNEIKRLIKEYNEGLKSKPAATTRAPGARALDSMTGKAPLLKGKDVPEEYRKLGVDEYRAPFGALGNIGIEPDETRTGGGIRRKPIKPISGDIFSEIDSMAAKGQLGVLGRTYLMPKPDLPRGGDKKEMSAYRSLIRRWSKLGRSKAEEILARRAAGESYLKIIKDPEIKKLTNYVSVDDVAGIFDYEPPTLDGQVTMGKLAQMKVDGVLIGSKRASRISKDYPKLIAYMVRLKPEELSEIMAAIDEGFTEQEILKHFRPK